MHPLDETLGWLSKVDFAVLSHSFLAHGRDFAIIVEDGLGSNPGRHELVFTHCVKVDYETRVADKTWPTSWSDEFLHYEAWRNAGEPDGYVWGTNWSLACPGIAGIPDSPIAAEWTQRLGKEMFEVKLETDRFFMRLIFHSIRWRKVGDATDTISQVLVPLPPIQ